MLTATASANGGNWLYTGLFQDRNTGIVVATHRAYLSLAGLLKCCDGSEHNGYCTACYTGNYPTELINIEELMTSRDRRN